MSLRKIMDEITEETPEEANAPKATQHEPAQPLGPREGFEDLFEELTGEAPKAPAGKPADPAGPA